MSSVWLIPSGLTALAAVAMVWAARALAAEVAALDRARVRLRPIHDGVRSVRHEVGRTSRATESTRDSLGRAPHR